MANHVSSLKRARQTETKTTANRANKSKLRSTLRTLREAIVEGNKKTIAATYSETVSILDKSVQKGSCTRTQPAATRPASMHASRPSSHPAKPPRQSLATQSQPRCSRLAFLRLFTV